jgi:hypothetical protein
MAERVGFELSVIFRIPPWELAPSLAHYSAQKKKILNQREFLGFDSVYRISLVPLMPDGIGDAFITSKHHKTWMATLDHRAVSHPASGGNEKGHLNHISLGKV